MADVASLHHAALAAFGVGIAHGVLPLQVHEGFDLHQQRIIRRSEIENDVWTIEVEGIDVPFSESDDFYSGMAIREGNLVWYWEDGDRDDADGPPTGVQ
jgi:hypothetical protein